MAQKKYLSLERLTEYDELIKSKIDEGDESTLTSAKSYADTLASGKANSSHTHDDIYYTETEIDSKLSTINASISNITGGTTVVKEAEHAESADTATSATKATQDGNGKVISSTYETKTDASAKLTEAKEYTDTIANGKADADHNHDDDYDAKGSADTALASAKAYADNAATTVKNDLLNGAGGAYDTLKELGDLIDVNVDAIEALEIVAAGKADKTHSHAIADVTGLQSALDGKADASHGTHVTFDSTNKPKMNGTAAFGTSANVARADHVHPTDTSRAAQTDLDALEEVVAGKANTSHTHTIANIDNLQSTLDGKAASSHTHKVADISDLTATATELNYMDGVTSNVQTQLDNKAASEHAHSNATTSAAGFMTAAMVTKLNGIATGATKVEVDSVLNSTSTNPVQNKAVNSAITNLTSTVSTNTSSINSHTTAISNLQTAVSEIQEITSAEIQALFA